MSLRAVLFDLDFTLWRLDPAVFSAAGPEGFLSDEGLRRMVKSQQLSRISRLSQGWQRPGQASADDVAQVVIAMFEGFWRETAASTALTEIDGAVRLRKCLDEAGIPVSHAQASALWDAGYVPYPDFPIELYEDTLPTLEALRGRGLKMAIVTNSPWLARVRQPDIDALGLGSLVDAVLASADTGYRKPHPLIFERALAALGVKVEEAIMVGDELAADVAGARNAGMKGVWKRNGRAAISSPQADFVIDNLRELIALPLF